MEPFEVPLQASLRELAEETGASLPASRAVPLSPRAKEGRDPRGWTVTLPFAFWIPEPMPVEGGDDARHAEWVYLDKLDRLAFDHGAILCEALGRFWPNMPTFHRFFKDICAFGEPEDSPNEAIFFGGSFNPWHNGHRACVQLCPSQEKLIVVPDFSPFKKTAGETCFWFRYRQIKQEVSDSECSVFPGFCGMELPNPTIRWLPATTFPHKRLLLGDDSFVSFPKWAEAAALLESLDEILVVPRTADPESIKQVREWLRREKPECEVQMLGDHPYRDLSSTLIRRQEERVREP